MLIKRHFLFAIAGLLSTCFSVFADTVQRATETVVRVYRSVEAKVFGFAALVLKSVAEKTADLLERLKPLMKAKAFVLSLAKRERPELTGSWRMCPST